MAHNARALSDENWVRGLLVQGATMITIDQNTYKALTPNGGSWTPSGIIQVGGAGLGVGCVLDIDHANTSVFTQVGSRVRFGRLDATDVPKFSTPYSATYRAHYASLVDPDRSVVWQGSGRYSVKTRRKLCRFGWKLRVHDGATLSSATIQFRVTLDRSGIGVPNVLPAVRVARTSRTGLVEPLRDPDSFTDADGFYTLNPTPVDGNAYDQAGAAQSLTFTPSKNNVIDTSLYEYFFEVREEGGANSWTPIGSGNEWHAPSATFSATYMKPA